MKEISFAGSKQQRLLNSYVESVVLYPACIHLSKALQQNLRVVITHNSADDILIISLFLSPSSTTGLWVP
jgi:hypothetical protein